MFGRRVTAKWRERLVLDRVRHLFDDDEVVAAWAHVTSAFDERTGVISVTPARCVLEWDARDGAATVLRWDDLTVVDVGTPSAEGEWPLLRLEGGTGRIAVHLPLSSAARARTASRLLACIADNRPAHLETSADLSPGRTPQLAADQRGVRGLAQRAFVTVAGLLVILLGAIFASPFVPGPGALTTLFGLAILAREYDWAREVHRWLQQKVRHFAERLRARRTARDVSSGGSEATPGDGAVDRRAA